MLLAFKMMLDENVWLFISGLKNYEFLEQAL